MSNLNISGHGAEIRCLSGTAPAASAAGTVTGSAIDRIGANWLVLEAETGASTGSPTTLALDAKVTHCATSGGTYTDFVPGAAGSGAISQITAVNTRKRKTINLQGAYRYIKIVTTAAFTGGTSPTIANSVKAILGGLDILPAQADD